MKKIQIDLFLKHIDEYWKQHLQTMDQLRSGIGLRGYSQKDPKKEYQKEGYNLFSLLLLTIKSNVVRMIMLIEIDRRTEQEQEEEEEALKRLLAERQRQARLLGKSASAPQLSSQHSAQPSGVPSVAKQNISNPAKTLAKSPSIDDILEPLEDDILEAQYDVTPPKSVSQPVKNTPKPQAKGNQKNNQKGNKGKKR